MSVYNDTEGNNLTILHNISFQTLTKLGNNFSIHNLLNGDVLELIVNMLGDKRKSMSITLILTVIYVTIFVTGIAGNMCTFYVVCQNTYMRTVTNFYLLSISLADLLILCLGK